MADRYGVWRMRRFGKWRCVKSFTAKESAKALAEKMRRQVITVMVSKMRPGEKAGTLRRS